MSDDQIKSLEGKMEEGFQRMFTYINDFRTEVNEHFEKVETDVADLRGAVAELSAQVRDYHNESIILAHQVDKLRDAILQIARETGVKLSVTL